jgi:Amidase
MPSCRSDPEPVLAAAAASEARRRQGSPLGPIDGVPASVKDNIRLKGYPTRRGSKTGEDAPAAADSPAWLREQGEQGAVMSGKTCLPEHGWIGVCRSPLAAYRNHPQSLDSHARRLDRRRCCWALASWRATACRWARRRRQIWHEGVFYSYTSRLWAAL